MNLTDTAINNTTIANNASTQTIHSTTQGPENRETIKTVMILGVSVMFMIILTILFTIPIWKRRYRRTEMKTPNTQEIETPRLDWMEKTQYQKIRSTHLRKTYPTHITYPYDDISFGSNKQRNVICADEPPLELSELRKALENTEKEQSNDGNGYNDVRKPYPTHIISPCDDISFRKNKQRNVICADKPPLELSEFRKALEDAEKEETNDDNGDNVVEIQDDVSFELKETIIPLGHPTNEQTDNGNEQNCLGERASTSPNHCDRSLDWNRILRYLSEHIRANDWQAFFLCLYENTKPLATNINYQERIERIEQDSRAKSEGITCILLKQFRSWKEAAGNSASPDMIEATFAELGHMDKLEEFKNYMRDPPYLNKTEFFLEVEADDERYQSNVFSNTKKLKLSNPYKLPSGSKLVKETHSKISLEIAQNTASERFPPDGASVVNFDMTHNAGLNVSSDEPTLTSPDKALKELTAFDKSDGLVPNECQVYQFTGVSAPKKLSKYMKKRRQSRRCDKRINTRHRRKQKASKRLSTKSIVLLMESYVQLKQEIKPDMHGFSTRKTIDELQKSNIKRESALCLKYKEYCDIETMSTKKGDTMHILYIGEEMHVLKPNSYNKLKLYAENVRAQVVRRLQNTVEDDYMFIDYNGFPLQKKLKDSSDAATTSSSSEDDETLPEMDETCEDQN